MVLDPLSALSLAGTIVQFVDFSGKILNKSYELYASATGSLAVNDELGLVTSDLLKLVTKLRWPTNVVGATGTPAEVEVSLDKLCNECRKVANELLESLEETKVKGEKTKWASFRQAVKSTWSEKDRAALSSRLAVFKESLEMHILVRLSNSIDLASVQQSSRFDKLDEQTQNIILALLDSKTAQSRELQDQTRALSALLNRAELVIVNEHIRTRALIVNTMKQDVAPKASLTEAQEMLVSEAQHDEDTVRAAVARSLLQSLEYPTRTDRQEEIAPAYSKTFDWIFHEQPISNQKWDSLVEWLRCGTGIYWVNGKAGSGKSTLMRYICQHPETKRFLGHWAGPSPLGMAAFFFWSSGTVDQRSQAGLLRSVIFEILQQHQELTPIVLPWHWSRRYAQIVDPSVEYKTEEWTMPQLMQAFKALVRQDISRLKLCLFIDGLDEYDGDHEKITQLFEDISSPNVKVCVSSRPLLVFKNAFGDLPSLRLQDLTLDDINQYVDGNLKKNERYKKLALQEPDRAPALVDEIVNKADGVFLWVILVVESLISGLGNRDGIIDLQRRLLLLPSDLEDLYHHMLMRIDSFYQIKASEIFQIFYSNWKTINNADRVLGEPWLDPTLMPQPLTALLLSFATDDEPERAFGCHYPLSDKAISERCETISDRLKVRCAGLLEIQSFGESAPGPNAKVMFIHRTARDYLTQSKVWTQLLSLTAGSPFNPYSSLLQGYILELKNLDYSEDLYRLRAKVDCIMSYACHVDFVTNQSNTVLLDELNKSMSSSLSSISKDYWANSGVILQLGERHNLFLSFAVTYSLCSYVDEKLNREPHLLVPAWERPLLDFAVNPRPRAKKYPCSAKMAALLLKHGANPNYEYNGRTAWQNALAWQLEFHRVGGVQQEDFQAKRSDRAAIFRLMINHGADPNVHISVYSGNNPLSVVDTCFQGNEATELGHLLLQHGAKPLTRSSSSFRLDSSTGGSALSTIPPTNVSMDPIINMPSSPKNDKAKSSLAQALSGWTRKLRSPSLKATTPGHS